jgi:hypothetical protein
MGDRSFFAGGGGGGGGELAYLADDTSANVGDVLGLAGVNNMLPSGWTIEDGTASEEDWWGGDLTGKVLQIPVDGTLLWHVNLVMSGNLPGNEYARGSVDFADNADPVFGAESEWAAAVTFSGEALNADARDTWTSSGWLIMRAPANRVILSSLGLTASQIASWQLSIVKVT